MAIAGCAAAVLVVGLAILVKAGRTPSAKPAAAIALAQPSSPTPETKAAPAIEQWIAPAGKREDVEALAYAFPSLDEHDLGSLFDAELKPVYGAQALFEAHEPRRIRRDAMSHDLLSLQDTVVTEHAC